MGFSPVIIKGVCTSMEHENHSRRTLWIVLITLLVVFVALALIIRNEKRFFRFIGKLEKRLHFGKKKNVVPITVEI